MLLVGAFFVVTPNTVSADLWDSRGYFYTLSGVPFVATITGYNGTGGSITIPVTLGAAGFPTVAINDSAFSPNSNITSLTIPSGIITIGDNAFLLCHSVTSLTIGNSVTAIGNSAFQNCHSLTSLTIGDSVTTFGDYVFSYCSSITSVIIPDSVTSIGVGMFGHCSALTSVTLPNNINIIDYYMFSHCVSLTSIIIPDSVITINPYVFDSCTSLTSVTIPDSVTTIGNYAFKDCSALTLITIGNSVTSIGTGMFRDCTSLTSINFLGLVAPTTVLANWIQGTPAEIRGHAYASSNFPPPGGDFHGLTMGEYISGNNPPVLGAPSPTNGSTGNTLSLTWSIPISDPESDHFSFTIECSNGAAASGSGHTNGTKPLELSELVYSTTYKVWVNATDPAGSNLYTRRWYTFMTMSQPWSNRPPTFSNPSPANESTAVNRYHATNVTVNDLDGNLTSVCFWYSTSNSPYSWTKTQQNNSVPANTTVRDLNSSYSSGWNTPYWWKVTSDDSHVNSSVIYTFTTQGSGGNTPPVFGIPSPTNGSTGTPLSLTWSIPINDPEGDSINWNITCSNGQSADATGEGNGTKTIFLSGLASSTPYTVWVNATDPSGSGFSTHRWYTYTTRKTGGSQPPPSPPGSSNDKPIADTSAGEPYLGFINTAITFNGSQSYDPDGTITKWIWDFGDTTNGTGEIVQHAYAKAGQYTVTLTVTDDQGATNTITTTCMVSHPNRPPTTPIITGPTNGTQNTLYTYTAVSTDADNDTLNYTFHWGDQVSQSSGFIPNGSSSTMNHSWIAAGRYSITVTVTDNQTIASSKTTVYIDALQIGNIGYLLDTNSDGTYDTFHNDTTAQNTLVNLTGSTYLIDNNGDGTWDYAYDTTQGLRDYIESETPGFDSTYLIGILIVGVICVGIVGVLLWKKKRIP